MAKKLLVLGGSLLGLGAVGYYAVRAYRKSDHSFRGTVRQCREEFLDDVRDIGEFAKRLIGDVPEKMAEITDASAEGTARYARRKSQRSEKFGDDIAAQPGESH